MASRVFALIVGIDKYKSGRIWNLESCVDDARSVRRMLSRDLHVPNEHIILLADAAATKRTIEDAFASHLIENPAIERGDAILIYFAGHGSSMRSPRGWSRHAGHNKPAEVEVLCPYDHDCKTPDGRNAGISDKSFNAMLRDLAEAKGDNITVILDCCFTPSGSASARKHTRWTPTTGATKDDLIPGLWESARGRLSDIPQGFARSSSKSYHVLAASQPGGVAVEGMSGGLFTHALLSIVERYPLHTMTYANLFTLLQRAMHGQKPALVGEHSGRTIFDGIPFEADPCLVAVQSCDYQTLRIGAGGIHGVIEGTEFTIHEHNHMNSLNPPRAICHATEVHPTWCLARLKSQSRHDGLAVYEGWARVTRWNTRSPLREGFQRSFFSMFGRRSPRRTSSTDTSCSDMSEKGADNARVQDAVQANISVTLYK